MALRQMKTRVSSQSLDEVTEAIFSSVISEDLTKLKKLSRSLSTPSDLLDKLTQQNENGCTCLGVACEKGFIGRIKTNFNLSYFFLYYSV